MSQYGRTDEECRMPEDAGWKFLTQQAKARRTPSYTEMSTVLARRTSIRKFDFDLDGERWAMGYLLGRLSERSLQSAHLLISVLVQYLNDNDAGLGLYQFAQAKKITLAPVRGRKTGLMGRARQGCTGLRVLTRILQSAVGARPPALPRQCQSIRGWAY